LLLVGLTVNHVPSLGKLAAFGDVVISEVAWMGTSANSNHEWIELYNNTSASIDLTNWKLVSLTDSTPNFTISTVNCSNVTIPAQGFFLLERTSNSPVSDITADCIYTGALSDGGEALALKDPSNNTIDTANGDGGAWPAGTASPRATMERISLTATDSDTNWDTNDGVHRNGLDANNNPINGTPKAPRQRASFNALDVVISEIAWMGTQADSNDEWIELYNNTSQAISLMGWKLEAADGTPTITLSGTIPANGFFLLERTDDTTVSDVAADQIYTGSLSNTGETLTLKDPSGNVIDTANGDDGAWPAGNDSLRRTMERLDLLAPDSDANWATNNEVYRNGLDAGSNPLNGTPKAHKPPYVNITSPTGTAPVYSHQGASFTLSFTTDEVGLYQLTVDGISCGTGTVSAGAQSVLCTLPGVFAEGARDITVTVTDNTNTAGSDGELGAVIVDNTPPDVTLIAPNGGEIIPANRSFTIEWSCSDLYLGATPIELFYSADDGATFPNIVTPATENDDSFEWVVPNIDTNAARVRAQCTDWAGNSATDDSDNSFTIQIITLGDINFDGKINAIDARMAQQHADGVITLIGNQFLAADVDQDSDVDSADATGIAKKGIGLPTGIPGFALEPHPRPLSVNGEGNSPFSEGGWGVRSGWLFLAFTLPALALLRRHRRIAMLLLALGLVGTLTGCVEFSGLPPPSGPAVFLTSTAMPSGATRTIHMVVQQITSSGGAASLQGRITYPAGKITVQSLTGMSGFMVKAFSIDTAVGELRFSLVKPTAGGVSNGPVLRLAISAAGAPKSIMTLSWTGSAQAPVVVGGGTNTEITEVSLGNGQVKVR
jgi:hypothetical protein